MSNISLLPIFFGLIGFASASLFLAGILKLMELEKKVKKKNVCEENNAQIRRGC